jgi:hypothetical protein
LRAVDRSVLRSLDVKWWHVAGGLFILLVGIPYLASMTPSILLPGGESPSSEFSDEERELRARLETALASLLITDADLTFLPGEFYDCTDPALTGEFDYERDARGNVVEVRNVKAVNPTRVDSDVCEGSTNMWVGTALALARSKEGLDHLKKSYAELSVDEADLLADTVDAKVEQIVGEGRPFEMSWVTVPRLGDASYALRFTLENARFAGAYTYYNFTFTRGVVEASLTVRAQAGTLEPDDAIRLAYRLDQKIQDEISVLHSE